MTIEILSSHKMSEEVQRLCNGYISPFRIAGEDRIQFDLYKTIHHLSPLKKLTFLVRDATLELPEKVGNAVLDFLQEGRPRYEWNCVDLARAAFSLPFARAYLNMGKSVFETIKSLDVLESGDVLLRRSKDKETMHFAIYLGEGYYLSKYGECDLHIHTYGEMKKAYPETEEDCLVKYLDDTVDNDLVSKSNS